MGGVLAAIGLLALSWVFVVWRWQDPFTALYTMWEQSLTAEQPLELAAMEKMNRRHLLTRLGDPLLTARIKSFETAFGMQMEAPDIFDLSKESDATHQLYGLQRGSTNGFGWQCLVARRLAERGVRFIEVIDGGSSDNWDSHGDMMAHEPLAKNVDQPIAGLLQDLKQRGMLDDTLVVWTTEFGRTPFKETAGAKGREHHHWVGLELASFVRRAHLE